MPCSSFLYSTTVLKFWSICRRLSHQFDAEDGSTIVQQRSFGTPHLRLLHSSWRNQCSESIEPLPITAIHESKLRTREWYGGPTLLDGVPRFVNQPTCRTNIRELSRDTTRCVRIIRAVLSACCHFRPPASTDGGLLIQSVTAAATTESVYLHWQSATCHRTIKSGQIIHQTPSFRLFRLVLLLLPTRASRLDSCWWVDWLNG